MEGYSRTRVLGSGHKEGIVTRARMEEGDILCILPFELLDHVLETPRARLQLGKDKGIWTTFTVKVPKKRKWRIKVLYGRFDEKEPDVRSEPRRHQARRSKK